MKALRFHAFGPPSVLQIDEIPMPEPGEGEALIQATSETSRGASRTRLFREHPAGTLRVLS